MRKRRRNHRNFRLELTILLILSAGVWGYVWLEGRQAKIPADLDTADQLQPGEQSSNAAEVPAHPIEQQEPPPPGASDAPRPKPRAADFEAAVMRLVGEGPVRERLFIDNLVDRLVTTADNLPRNSVAERVRPWRRIAGQFRVRPHGDDSFEISPDNAARYQGLLELASVIDSDEAVTLYRRFYPLFQTAYESLGYPDGYFNDRLVEVIDDLLATPEPKQPLVLVRPHVLYEFQDPELESLSSGQKMILRMGVSNAREFKSRLRSFRSRITGGSAIP